MSAVRATEEHFGSVFNEAPIGMSIISTAGVIVRVNRAMCEMSGYTEADLIGMDFQAMAHPEDVMLDHQQILGHPPTQFDGHLGRRGLCRQQ